MTTTSISKNSTTVRLPFPSALLTTPLQLAPWLRKPVLTRLFLSPMKRAPGGGESAGDVVGTLTIGQAKVRVRARGRGPAVLLVHGWQSSAAHLASIGQTLVSSGFTVVTCDMPAHGETSGVMTNVHEFAQAVQGAADLVGPLHGIVAHSLGATATGVALTRGLKVPAVVFLAPMPSFDFALDEFAKMLDLTPELREAAAVGTERRVGVKRPEVDLHAFPPPTAHIALAHDKNDPRVPYARTVELARKWRTSNLLSTEGLGHKRILEDSGIQEWIVAELRKVAVEEPAPLSFPCAPEMRI